MVVGGGTKMICPCKDCENKGCGVYHSQCEKYLEYRESLEMARKKEKEEKMFFERRRKNGISRTYKGNR